MMASIGSDSNGGKRILFVAPDGKRKTVRLGKCSRHDAEAIKYRVKNLLSALIQGNEPSRDDAEWLGRIGSPLRKKLVRVGLVKPTKADIVPNTSDWLDGYIKGRTDIKPRTINLLENAKKSFLSFWGGEKLLTEFTAQDAFNFRVYLLSKKLAEATVRARCKKIKQVFNAAKKKRHIESNPFDEVPTADRTDATRQRYIDQSTIEKVIEACPDHQWRLIFALARYGGIRIPSELVLLTWDDILWDKKRFIVHSPKTEHIEGKESRVVPLFPKLEPYLVEAFERAEPGESRIITIYDEKNANLRTQAHRIIKKAGLEPWPKTFQNLRSSCETELCDIHPETVVTKWIGNSVTVAKKHYLQLTEEHFARAVNVAQNPAQQLHESTRNDSQIEFNEAIKKSVSPEVFKALQILANSCISTKTHPAPRVGLEPTTWRLTAARSAN
jgi:integrase